MLHANNGRGLSCFCVRIAFASGIQVIVKFAGTKDELFDFGKVGQKWICNDLLKRTTTSV